MINIENLLLEAEFYMDDVFLTEALSDTAKSHIKKVGAGLVAATVGKYALNSLKNKHINKVDSINNDLVSRTDAFRNSLKGKGYVIDPQNPEVNSGLTSNDIVSAKGIENKEKISKMYSDLKTDHAEFSKNITGNEHLAKVQKFAADNHDLLSTGITSSLVVGVGAYALYKFFHSLTYINFKIKKIQEKLKSDPKNELLKNKFKLLNEKRKVVLEKLRKENTNFINKTKLMKAKVNELNKAGNKMEALKLNEKLLKRMKFIQKIEAKI